MGAAYIRVSAQIYNDTVQYIKCLMSPVVS